MTDDNTEDQDKYYEHYKLNVDRGQEPRRMDKFLMDRLEGKSRNKIQQAIKAGCVMVNGTAVKANYKIRPLDEVSIVMAEPPREFELIPENIPINVVYEDEHLIVVNKAAGMVVHPGYGNYSGTLVHALSWHFDQLPVGSDPIRPGLVHRIDKNTTGLMVIAKDEFSMAHLARQFFEHSVERTYQALVWGSVKEQEGTITGNIARSRKDRKIFAVFKDEDIGRHAVTHYKVLENFGYVTLVECKLETGRTHQIRVHMKYIGHTLFMDQEYGGEKILKGSTSRKYRQFIQNCIKIINRQSLHAKTLGFIHPHTGKKMQFDSELPEDLNAVIEKWRNYFESLKIST